MPRISAFEGIEIYMYYNDHLPPHFHALYAEDEAIILIPASSRVSTLYEGDLPKRKLKLVFEWASMHRQELMDDWELARKNQPLKKISPL